MKPRCEIIAISDVEHLQQIYAGFAMLHRAGEIELRQTIPRQYLNHHDVTGRWNDYKFFNATVRVNDLFTITYDTHDWNWIDPDILAKSDLYFKRSFDPEFVATLADPEKVYPLGLNMQVNDSARDLFRLRRSRFYGGGDRVKTVLKALRIDNYLSSPETERIDRIEAEPNTSLTPRILYMVRLWDPRKIESKKQSEAVEEMNASRAECVTRMRKEFGDNFFGGVAHDEYSAKYFADALLPDGSLANKRTYLETLPQFPICVATVGLNGSNGWKLAEYVAQSKAIISEPLRYAVPGDFSPETNYLEFMDADELIEAGHRLMNDAESRASMMQNNSVYYRNYVRADALVRNSLDTVLERLGDRAAV